MLNNLINLVVGLFFLLGAIIAFKNHNNKNLTNFSVGMAFVVLLILLAIDIIPETLELFENNKYIWIISGSLIGCGILFLIEKIVPHHNHFEEEKHHHHEEHLKHIGTMTSVALIIHNIVEGMSIYGVASNDLKTGLIYALGVGLHNIPFGIEITAMFEGEKNRKKTWTFLIILTLSTFVGGLALHLFKDLLTDQLLGILLSLTVGMILYIVFNELLVELKEKFNKYSIYGIITGIILMLIGVLI